MTMSTSQTESAAADLAEYILTIARRIAGHETPDSRAVRLSNIESLVMRYIDRNPGSSPSEIGAAVGLRSGNMSAALRSLENKGLARRSPDPKDGRVVRVDPTAAASTNLDRLREEWAELLGPLLPVDQDVSAVVQYLRSLDARLQPQHAKESRLPSVPEPVEAGHRGELYASHREDSTPPGR
jgi:Transcriptional regulators